MADDNNTLRIEYVPLREVKRWPRNPKLHVDADIEKSIEKFGFTSPLLLDENTGRIVAGHGRLESLIRMADAGKPPPARIRRDKAEWLVPVVRGVSFTNEAEAEAYLLADNRLVELGGWDHTALETIIADIVATSGGNDTIIGFTQAEIDCAKEAMLSSDVQSDSNSIGAKEVDLSLLAGTNVCPRCKFTW